MTTVALIEDDLAYREGIDRLLTDSGRFSVLRSFDNAEDALEALPKNPPQIALVDINFPGVSGRPRCCACVRAVLLCAA